MISYEVEFPIQKSFSLNIGGFSAEEGLNCRTKEAIGGEVKVRLEKKAILMVPYCEDITPDFTLEGYKLRAVSHAENVITKLVEAAQEQAANNSLQGIGKNLDSIINSTIKNRTS